MDINKVAIFSIQYHTFSEFYSKHQQFMDSRLINTCVHTDSRICNNYRRTRIPVTFTLLTRQQH